MRYTHLGGAALLAVALVVFPSHAGPRYEGVTSPEQPGPTQVQPEEVPNRSCLANTLCAIKARIRWRTPPWTAEECQRLADVVLEAAQREQLPPALIVAVMINESSLDERATRVTMKDGVLHSKDGGLMGIRCVFGRNDRCKNGLLRGRSWQDVMSPANNIKLGAQALAYWRDVGGVVGQKVTVRTANGAATRVRYRRCTHRDHPYWAHYNHGVRYIGHGRPRLYPHHIAVLYYALSRTMETDTANLTSLRLSAERSGKRRADRPIGSRHAALFRTILGVGPLCGDFLTAQGDTAREPRAL